ncbi:MAG: PLP-dependent aminotransferase family protein [Rhodoferax sp.]|nr:PLP-dependent aminotransferase family protein [Rhodoferax sp.]
MLTRHAETSLTGQLSARFAQRIRDRLMAPGARLPSVRQCAQAQGVSPSTVVAAYDHLLALGLVEARRNRGFFVRDTQLDSASKRPPALTDHADVAPDSGADRPSPLPAPVNATMLIRGMFHRPSDRPQPGMGAFPPDWLDAAFMPAALRRVSSTRNLQLLSQQYGEPAGDANLRRAMAARLRAWNVEATPQQIITTVGATHALDVISRTLLRPGDPVMVEEPGWAIELARLQALGMRVLPVPRGPGGPDLAVMARYCEVHAPRLFISVSVLHNPTGDSLSPAAAHQVLRLAEAHDFHIVEDDTYAHIAPDHATRLAALDGLRRTIHVGGFSKVLAPNWRIGYLAAPLGLVERLLDTKLLTTLTTPALLEQAMALCIEQGHLRRHAERLRIRLGQARDRSVQLARSHGCRLACEPAGLFGWVDTGVDTDALSARLLDAGYLLAPGSLFHAGGGPSPLMRINFATTQDAQFWQAYSAARARL